jgi:molybdenum cofactor guanylyltransferase
MMAREDITGLVLAGGRGSRMGGVDKGLQLHHGVPLALHALQRLSPQVGRVALNANRNLQAYAAMGVAVWPDVTANANATDSSAATARSDTTDQGSVAARGRGLDAPDAPRGTDGAVFEPFAGPLAGWLAGLAACQTPWLVTVPCDTPNFPLNLVQTLSSAAVEAGADVAMASGLEGGQQRLQPVFCLLKRELQDSLRKAMAEGERKVDRWAARHRLVVVGFDDPRAFFNANTVAELALLQGLAGPP